ncbi:MAG: hypothetical protein Q9219_007163 [cf. Caloplaca sp. 3 TL-2023]
MNKLPEPTPADFADNRGPTIRAAQLTVAILATLGISLRFLARYLQKSGYGIDDYAVLLALAYYATRIIWPVSIVFVKSSILFFYLRIFGGLLWLRRTAYGLLAFTVVWAVMTVLVFIFQCNPVALAWDQRIEGGHCINAWLFFAITSALDVITDFAILILPQPAGDSDMLQSGQPPNLV